MHGIRWQIDYAPQQAAATSTVTTFKTISITEQTFPSVIRLIGYIRTLSDLTSPTAVRSMLFSRSTTELPTTTITRQIGHNPTVTEGVSNAITRQVGLIRLVGQTLVPSYVKGLQFIKTISATIRPIPAYVKAITYGIIATVIQQMVVFVSITASVSPVINKVWKRVDAGLQGSWFAVYQPSSNPAPQQTDWS